MTWTAIGGLIGSELMKSLVESPPNYAKIDRLTNDLLLDCLYRGYNLDYLTTLFDRLLPPANSLRDGLIHVFRRLSSPQHHRYEVWYWMRGASTINSDSSVGIRVGDKEELLKINEGLPTIDYSITNFLAIRDEITPPFILIAVECTGEPDAGAAAESTAKRVKELLDYWDFDAPAQKFELLAPALVTWKEGNRSIARLHPNESTDQRPRPLHEVEINPEWAGQISGLAEAFRWSSVARRETTPEVALLAAWFAFEFLAANTGKTPVEGIMEFFPRVLAVGNLRRRLHYWWKSLSGSPGFESHANSAALKAAMTQPRGGANYSSIMQLLLDVSKNNQHDESTAAIEIASSSVLLRERTNVEAKLFSNSQLIAQTLKEDAKDIQRELQRFLLIRNKLVHRARIDHPLLTVVSDRAKSRLYDLLHDLMTQLTQQRLEGTVTEVLHDYRDTFEELVADLGSGNIPPADFINRVLLS